jgi:hypothetical protein
LGLQSENDAIDSFFLVVLFACAGFAQEKRSPVYVSHSGQDKVGALFEAALRNELSHSSVYALLKFEESSKTKFEFHIGLASVDVAVNNSEQAKRSVVSVVIEEFGLPNSYPVAELWYHKVIVVDKDSVDAMAKDLVDDMGARWCHYITNQDLATCGWQKRFTRSSIADLGLMWSSSSC